MSKNYSSTEDEQQLDYGPTWIIGRIFYITKFSIINFTRLIPYCKTARYWKIEHEADKQSHYGQEIYLQRAYFYETINLYGKMTFIK